MDPLAARLSGDFHLPCKTTLQTKVPDLHLQFVSRVNTLFRKLEWMNLIEKIRLIICPDQRKSSRSEAIYKPCIDPENFELIRSMISQGFFRGEIVGAAPIIYSSTWKANDLYMATQKEGVRIRLMARFRGGLDIEALHQLAVSLHSEYGNKWNRLGR